MSDKKDSYPARGVSFDEVSMCEDELTNGREWHLQFAYNPEFPYPFPIVPEGTHDKHDAVGHLSHDGRVHVFNAGIIEQLVRAGLRMRVVENRTKSDGG